MNSQWLNSRVSGQLGGLLVVAGLVICGAGVASACNIPVFRYALERWHPDPYRVTLFHRGPLAPPQQAALEPWTAGIGESPANLALELVDVDAITDEDQQRLLDEQRAPEFPWIVVRYPKSLRIEATVWSGAWSESSWHGLTHSPLRTELVRRLAAGETAVWMMLECGDAAKDDAVAARLTDELQQLAKQLDLPALRSVPEDDLLSSVPLKVAFSLLRVPRDPAAEPVLIDLLLRSEPDLVEFSEPMVFPVFGRGRALLPLIGAGITTENIHESAGFLVGACSCEIKDLNPGFDLLLAAHWEELLFDGAAPPASLAGRATVPAGEIEYVPIPAGPSVSAENESPVMIVACNTAPDWLMAIEKYWATGLLCIVLTVVVAWRRFA